MNELREEIRQTILALNQENAQPIVEELQCHLANLFDMVRDELQQRLKESSWSEPSIGIARQVEAPYKSVKLDGQIDDEAKPLTTDELMAGGWWCSDVSEECRLIFADSGVGVTSSRWNENANVQCAYKSNSESNVLRAYVAVNLDDLKQIHRIGNDFFWGEK